MNVTIEKISSIKRKLTVELPEQVAVATRKKHLDNYTRKARLKGFRPGKAPRSIVAKIYAEELHREVLEELVKDSIPDALEQHQLKPVGLPQLEDVNYQEGQPYIYSVMVELKPEFTTPQWQGLELEKVVDEITDEVVDKKIEELRLSLSTVSKIDEDRPIAMGEVAEISYKAFKGEEEVKDIGLGPFRVELGRDQMLPGFSEGVVGMKAGEEKDIKVTMPQESKNKELAGQELNLHTTLSTILVREMPALDDELAKDLGVDGVETLAALRERIHQDLSKERDERIDDLFNRQLTLILANMVEVEVPSVMLEREINNKVEGMRREFSKNGLDFSKMGVNIDILRQRFSSDAEKSVTAALVLDQIASDNQIEISEQDLDQELEEMSKEYGQTPEMLRSFYEARGLISSLREGLRAAKTLDLIKAQAIVTEVDKINPEKLGMSPTQPPPKPGDEPVGEIEDGQGENHEPGGENPDTDGGNPDTDGGNKSSTTPE